MRCSLGGNHGRSKGPEIPQFQHCTPFPRNPKALPTASFCQWEEALTQGSRDLRPVALWQSAEGSHTSHRPRKSRETAEREGETTGLEPWELSGLGGCL